MQPPSTHPVIRQAATNDLDDLLPLFEGYLAFYGIHHPDQVTARRYLGDRLALGDTVVLLARTASGRPLGFAHLFPSFTSLGMAPIWVLNDLYVGAHARGLGVGQALLDAVTEHARRTGRTRVVLETATDNRPARALYERHGFQPAQGFITYSLAVDAPAGAQATHA